MATTTEASLSEKPAIERGLRDLTAPQWKAGLAAWLAAVASYQFYQQRSDSTVRSSAGRLIAEDADQNRLFVGLQFGYPITFDRP